MEILSQIIFVIAFIIYRVTFIIALNFQMHNWILYSCETNKMLVNIDISYILNQIISDLKITAF